MSEQIQHSNRFKRLRRLAESLAKVPDSLRAIEKQVYLSIYDSKKDEDGVSHRIVIKPNAKNERNKYAMHVVMIRKLQAFWIPRCKRRIYKDMKRAGIG